MKMDKTKHHGGAEYIYRILIEKNEKKMLKNSSESTFCEKCAENKPETSL